MNVDQLADSLRRDPMFMENVVRWEELPARPAQYAPFPEGLDPRLVPVLQRRGVHQLYSHQAHAVREVLAGRDVVVVTPTASGKTMCYNLPVLQRILQNEDSRALYLFPTKALSADQVAELYELITALNVEIKTFTYDGDTPAAARRGQGNDKPCAPDAPRTPRRLSRAPVRFLQAAAGRPSARPAGGRRRPARRSDARRASPPSRAPAWASPAA